MSHSGGSLLPGRNYSSSTYAFGFNGMRKDDEIHGATGTSYDFGARLYDPRVGRWLSLDPLAMKFAHTSPYCAFAGNPIGVVDPGGMEVIWHSSLLKNAAMSSIIKVMTITKAHQSIFARFIANQSNIVLNKGWLDPGTFGQMFPAPSVPGDPSMHKITFASSNFVNGQLAMDATLAVKVLLHEGVHAKWVLGAAQYGMSSYPTLASRTSALGLADGHHQTMAEGSRGLFVEGMKEFDAASGTSHSEDWYQAMSWFGSLEGTSSFAGLESGTKARYDAIIKNENAYNGYLQSKYRYEANPTARNERRMTSSLSKVDRALFNDTRNRESDAEVE